MSKIGTKIHVTGLSNGTANKTTDNTRIYLFKINIVSRHPAAKNCFQKPRYPAYSTGFQYKNFPRIILGL